ncbi:unnamed protein product [Rhizophagus irregularis]|nr:unnamed protein product [Rhizophagus irregularis]
MSCSKIFSGDLPELIYEIIKYFQNDYSTLYSCILVNKLWCRLAIPLLWEDPFSIPTKNYNFIKIYLHNLNDDDFNTKLDEYKIVNNSLPSNILFNYPRFLKYLNIYEFIYLVEKWFKSATGIRKQLATTDFEKLSFICVSIFRIIIIENEVNLHTLEIEKSGFDYYLACIGNILELILKNPNFIHHIRNLNLYFGNSYVGSSKYTLMNNRISQIIKLHQNLKKIMQIIYQLLNLIENIKLSINYLSFDVWYDYTETGGYSSIILQDLGQILPSKLEYLCLNIYHVKTNDFELFLKNIQDTFIKKLVIENFQFLVNILPSIKEYIMKKKRVKYLAIKNSTLVKELISLKDVVDEFKLYNIKVQSYDDLKINLRNYIKKID